MDFDFIAEETKPEPITPEVMHGPNIANLAGMTRKKLISELLQVYTLLGGAQWVFTQAMADPKSYMSILNKLIPTNVSLDLEEGLSVKLIDRYGNSVEIEPGASDRDLTLDPPGRTEGPNVNVSITETFGPSSPQTVTGNSPNSELDFTL